MSNVTHNMPAKAKTSTPAKRMTLSQVLEALLARGAADRSSVSLARNARGETQIEVTVRTGDNSDVTDVLGAEKRACEIYDRLSARYPRASQNGGENA